MAISEMALAASVPRVKLIHQPASLLLFLTRAVAGDRGEVSRLGFIPIFVGHTNASFWLE
jgi:hypothetical protein